MPLFDLGSDCKATQNVNAPIERAYELSRQILESYKSAGFRLRYETEKPPTDLVCEFSDSDGTKIKATVRLTASSTSTSQLNIQLTGKVHVGGLKGKLASDSKVQSVAREKLIEEIKKALKQGGLAAAIQPIHQREQIYAHYQQRAGGTALA